MGECAKCGACCLVIPIYKVGLTDRHVEWFAARGCVETDDYFLIPHRCPHLLANNTCDIHDKEGYPRACREYDGRCVGDGVIYYVPEQCAMR